MVGCGVFHSPHMISRGPTGPYDADQKPSEKDHLHLRAGFKLLIHSYAIVFVSHGFVLDQVQDYLLGQSKKASSFLFALKPALVRT